VPRSAVAASTSAPVGLRERQKEYTRSLLLAAATDVFREVGYHNATIGQVADAAGTSRPTFYQYFASKSEIAIELMRELQQHADAVFSRLFALEPLTLAGVRTWVTEAIELWDPANPRVTIVDQATTVEADVRAARDAMSRSFIESVAAFLRRRHTGLSLADARLHACHLIAEFHVLDLTYLLGMPATSKVTVHALADSWWAVLDESR